MTIGSAWVKAKDGDPRAAEWARKVASLLKSQGVDVYADPVIARYIGGDVLAESGVAAVDLAIVIGGDGTLLRVVQKSGGHLPPLLCLCSDSLGYLYPHRVEDYEQVVNSVLSGNYEVDTAKLGSFRCGDLSGVFLNEVEILAPLGKVMSFKVSIDGEEIYRFRGDGVIVATPAGSTGHALAMGGPVILNLGIDVIEVVPMAPLSVTAKPLIVGSDRTVTVEVMGRAWARPAQLVIDGQRVVGVERRTKLEATGGGGQVLFIRAKGAPIRTLSHRYRIRVLDPFT